MENQIKKKFRNLKVICEINYTQQKEAIVMNEAVFVWNYKKNCKGKAWNWLQMASLLNDKTWEHK